MASTDLYVLAGVVGFRLRCAGLIFMLPSDSRRSTRLNNFGSGDDNVAAAMERKQRYLRIVDQEQRRIVTVVELLSPANKTTSTTGVSYRQKREEYIASGINVVEIDLLRAGSASALGRSPADVERLLRHGLRNSEKPRIGLWPFSVRDPLPAVPIPLDDGVADSSSISGSVLISLQFWTI